MLFDGYIRFLQSFQRWFDRLSPREVNYTNNAPLLLSSLQALNIGLPLMLWNPPVLAGYVFLAVYLGISGALWAANARLSSKNKVPRADVGWSTAVPGLSEFPAVYAYIGLTFLQLMLTVVYAINR